MHLLGFVDPIMRFPATVIPVWADDAGALYGVFSARRGGNGIRRELYPLQPQSHIYTLPNDWTDDSIRECEPVEVCLLALTHEKLIAYPISGEEEVLSSLLADPAFAADQPFARLALSKLINQAHLVMAELLSCTCYLLTQEVRASPDASRARIESWLCEQRCSISEQFNASEKVQTLLSELPTKLEQLGPTTWWRRHMTVHPPAHEWTLEKMEDIHPSPQSVVIMNLEPTVPNEAVLKLMARHLLAGTNYLFFHAPTASEEVLNQLQIATEAAVAEAQRAAEGPLAELTAPSVGGVSFFALHRRWTSSPYVFYEFVRTEGRTVTGFRGVDVDAPISRSYERLKDDFAFELLEALTSKPPKPLEEDDGQETIIEMKDYVERSSG